MHLFVPLSKLLTQPLTNGPVRCKGLVQKSVRKHPPPPTVPDQPGQNDSYSDQTKYKLELPFIEFGHPMTKARIMGSIVDNENKYRFLFKEMFGKAFLQWAMMNL